MAVLCPDYNLLFIGNKRTGSTAIGLALVERYGGVFLPPERCVLHNQRVSKKHSNLAQLVRHRLLPVDPARLYKFAAVRNPFDSVVSMYLKARFRENRAQNACQRQQLVFKDYIRLRFPDRTPRSLHRKFVTGMDQIIRFEALQAGLSEVLAKVGAPDLLLPVINKTEEKVRHYSEFYDEESRDWIGRIFAEDLKRFNYRFETAPLCS